jgi:hypothetical protein
MKQKGRLQELQSLRRPFVRVFLPPTVKLWEWSIAKLFWNGKCAGFCACGEGACGRVGLGGVGEVWIHGNVPRFQQPFWDVAPISVSLAPAPKLGREDIRLCGESQLPDLHFELGRKHRTGPKGFSPVGIAAFTRHDWESGGSQHNPR